ncbi:MAG: hypothetical protein O3C57_08000 [Verrucomicrobia bacterium]|nr:hypothetical protein [Verrucomicrobiota bacterium]
MKNTPLIILCMLSGIVLLSGCGKGTTEENVSDKHYAEATKTNKELAKAMRSYLAELEKTEEAEDMAKAMNAFADELEIIWPRMQALSGKYPELSTSVDLPNKLKHAMDEVNTLNAKVGDSFVMIMAKSNDPQIEKAHERIFTLIMSK